MDSSISRRMSNGRYIDIVSLTIILKKSRKDLEGIGHKKNQRKNKTEILLGPEGPFDYSIRRIIKCGCKCAESFHVSCD